MDKEQKMKQIIHDNKIYTISTPNILSIIKCLENAIHSPQDNYQHLYNALSLSHEIILDEMRKQTPTPLTTDEDIK